MAPSQEATKDSSATGIFRAEGELDSHAEQPQPAWLKAVQNVGRVPQAISQREE